MKNGKHISYITELPAIQPPAPHRVQPPAEALRRPAATSTSSRFVSAHDAGMGAITPTRVEVLPPAQPPTMPDAPQTRVQMVTSGGHTDRALGFTLVVTTLAVVLGGLGAIIAVAAWGVPWLSVPALAWFGSLFAATWLIAYIVHVLISPEGSAWLHVMRGWRWLDREQAHRHELERRVNRLDGGQP